MTRDLNATFGAFGFYALYRRTTISHFAFCIYHSSDAFKHNQKMARFEANHHP